MKTLLKKLILIALIILPNTSISKIHLHKRVKFDVGFRDTIGRFRQKMEDVSDIITLGKDRQKTVFGIYDGHGGSQCSRYLEKNLIKNVVENTLFSEDIKKAIEESFIETNRNFLNSHLSSHPALVEGQRRIKYPGSTAILSLIIDKKLYVANVGDSRAVMCKNETAFPLSTDQTPEREDERQRIEKRGGKIKFNKRDKYKIPRVNGRLMVSRAFGNKMIDTKLIEPKPEINELTLDENDRFIIMASDGLWGEVKDQEAVDLVKNCRNTQIACQKLINLALQRGSTDNISVIIINDIPSYVIDIDLNNILKKEKLKIKDFKFIKKTLEKLDKKNYEKTFKVLRKLFYSLELYANNHKSKKMILEIFTLAKKKKTSFLRKELNISKMYKVIKRLF